MSNNLVSAYHYGGTYSQPRYELCERATSTFDCDLPHHYAGIQIGATVRLAWDNKAGTIISENGIPGKYQSIVTIDFGNGNVTSVNSRDVVALPND